MTVHNGFGQAGGAAGIDDPQRVVERQPGRFKALGLMVISGGTRCEICIACFYFNSIKIQTQVLQEQQMTHAGQVAAELGHDAAAVQVAPGVAHAVAGNQHLGLDLAQAVQHGGFAHVGRANAPDRPQADRGQKRHHGLGDIRQIGRHAVATLHPLGLQMQRQGRHLALQLGPAQFPVVAALVAADHRWQAGGVGRHDMAQHLTRVVNLRALEPPGPRHAARAEHVGKGCRRLHLTKVPGTAPERLQITDRPAPQRVIAVKTQTVVLGQPVLVQADLRNKGGG